VSSLLKYTFQLAENHLLELQREEGTDQALYLRQQI
jgi:hypothetical protein